MIAYFKRLIRSYFGFSGNQITGFLVLLPLMLVLVFAVPVYRFLVGDPEPDFSADVAFLDSLVFARQVSHEEEQAGQRTIVYTGFNPNRLDEEEFLQLGFPVHIAKRILRYREKGGEFRIKSDLKKIYGLDPALYKQLEPYILLPVLLPDRFVRYDAPVEKSSERVYTKKEILPFNLNTADTSQLKQIFGIGDVLSERIVKYRMQLGGFISVTQLKEVYRLDSATITRLLDHAFIEESFRPAGININLATEAELVRHPYISGSMAKAIVAYRFQHGKFDSLDELRKLVVVTATEREKIKPYLIVE